MNAELAALVNAFPAPAGDRKLTNPNGKEMAAALGDLARQGREAVAGLVEMLADPSEGTDTQARHALHALATHVAGGEDEGPRREVAAALAATLEGDLAAEAKGFVIRQIQVCGGTESIDALASQLADEALCDDATTALLAIGSQGEPFLKALAGAKTPKHRTTLIQALGDVRAVDAVRTVLLEAAKDKDEGTRRVALWALANIGQPGDVELLIAASNATGYERVHATKSCLLLAERLAAKDEKQAAAKIYRHLHETRDESEDHVRQAAERGLAAVG